MKVIIYAATSLFLLRKITYVYLKYSSTITRVYLLPPILCTCAGPKRSMCSRWKQEVIENVSLVLKDALWCFPFSQAEHGLSFEKVKEGIPWKRFFWVSELIVLKFKWEKHLFQSQLLLSKAPSKKWVSFSDCTWVISMRCTSFLLCAMRTTWLLMLKMLPRCLSKRTL